MHQIPTWPNWEQKYPSPKLQSNPTFFVTKKKQNPKKPPKTIAASAQIIFFIIILWQICN
jgi:hypothetical protein